jgi:tRNA-Thr(GGU) m(6)t(6)A37 methyltransferase TsaA
MKGKTSIKVDAIGIIKTSFSSMEIRKARHGVSGHIKIYDQYRDGLIGIEGFSHLIVLAYLHQVTPIQRQVLKVRYRRLLNRGVKLEELPLVGVFSSDSPHRPNPLAVTIVELVKREGSQLFVNGLDLFNNTPVLDIKHYTPNRVIQNISLPQWYKELEDKVAQAEKVTG